MMVASEVLAVLMMMMMMWSEKKCSLPRVWMSFIDGY